MVHIRNTVFLTILFCSFMIPSFGEVNDSIPINKLDMEISDIYIVKMKIDTILFQGNLCCHGKHGERLFKLYKISILKVLFMADTSIYVDKDTLQKVRYLVASSRERINISSPIFASLYNSNTSMMLLFGREIKLEDGKNYEFRYHAHLKGLLKCRRNDFKKFIDKLDSK